MAVQEAKQDPAPAIHVPFSVLPYSILVTCQFLAISDDRTFRTSTWNHSTVAVTFMSQVIPLPSG